MLIGKYILLHCLLFSEIPMLKYLFIYLFIYRHFFPFCPHCDLNLEPSITPSHPFGSNIEIFIMKKEIQSAGFWLML